MIFSKIYVWCKNEDKQNVLCFSKGISNEDIIDAKPPHARDFSHVRLHYIKDYGYSIYKEITKKQYKNFKVG